METRIGTDCLIMAYSHIAHDCIVGNHCIFSNNATLAGHIVVEDHVTIGGLVAIQQFVHIGAYAFITGGSLVRTDVPPFVKAAREPLAYMGVNSIGMLRRGLTEAQVQQIQNIYRILFVQKNNTSQALDIIENSIEASPERDRIIEFIRQSTKGIIKGLSAD